MRTFEQFLRESKNITYPMVNKLGFDPRQNIDGIQFGEMINGWRVSYVDIDAVTAMSHNTSMGKNRANAKMLKDWMASAIDNDLIEDFMEFFEKATNNYSNIDEKSFHDHFQLAIRQALLKRWYDDHPDDNNPDWFKTIGRYFNKSGGSYSDLFQGSQMWSGHGYRRSKRNLPSVLRKLAKSMFESMVKYDSIEKYFGVGDDQQVKQGNPDTFKKSVEYCRSLFQKALAGLAGFGLGKGNRVPVIFYLSDDWEGYGGVMEKAGRDDYVIVAPTQRDTRSDLHNTVHELVHVMYTHLPRFKEANDDPDFRKRILQMAYQQARVSNLPSSYARPHHKKQGEFSVPHLVGEEWLTEMVATLIVSPQVYGNSANAIAKEIKLILGQARSHGHNTDYELMRKDVPGYDILPDSVKRGTWHK